MSEKITEDSLYQVEVEDEETEEEILQKQEERINLIFYYTTLASFWFNACYHIIPSVFP